MIIKVLDNNHVEIEEYNGVMDNGVFNYTEGGFIIPLIKFRIGGTKKTLDIVYTDSITEKGNKVNYVQFNGKDYVPLIIHTANYTQKDHSVADYLSVNRQSEQAESEVLRKPSGLEELTKIIFIIALVVISITFYWATSNLIAQFQATIKPFNVTVAQQGVLINFMINQTRHNAALYNLTLSKINVIP